jgi:hypothetical protein
VPSFLLLMLRTWCHLFCYSCCGPRALFLLLMLRTLCPLFCCRCCGLGALFSTVHVANLLPSFLLLMLWTFRHLFCCSTFSCCQNWALFLRFMLRTFTIAIQLSSYCGCELANLLHPLFTVEVGALLPLYRVYDDVHGTYCIYFNELAINNFQRHQQCFILFFTLYRYLYKVKKIFVGLQERPDTVVHTMSSSNM